MKLYALLALSLFFYACGSPRYFLLFFLLVFCNVIIAYLISYIGKKGRDSSLRIFGRVCLVMGILINLSVLFYYKYYDFTVTSINTIAGTAFNTQKLMLPLGISFFTFKAISLLSDVYHGKCELGKDPGKAALYLSFYGQIISGPISKYDEFFLGYDESGKAGIRDWFSGDGSRLFLRGFCKKIIFANVLGLIVAEVFATEFKMTSSALLWLGSIAYSLQLYYDFSGYSDMAIGVGKMAGINCNENFNYPYCAASISEFWRRWHISLGNWFKDYVYFPLGGSRVKTKRRLYLNLLAVWLLTGIWHGA
ncbi:MAG: MBOAT family protein, partial [Parasporobacterium sp.]|nr:MBOAT family protein [Parasporobacterium sp.]